MQKISLNAHHALEPVICRVEALLQTGDFASSTSHMTGHRPMNTLKVKIKGLPPFCSAGDSGEHVPFHPKAGA